MYKKPEGNVTFLFTDIEGSTKLAQKDSANYVLAHERHNDILSEIFESNNGFVFQIVGDAYCCAFENSSDAIKAAVETQIRLSSEDWGRMEIKVRMGIHSGMAEWSGSDYMGYLTLARTSRLMSTAHGNQILISGDVYDNFRDDPDHFREERISFRDFGERRLKDLITPMRIFQVVSERLQSEFPPIRTLDARPNNIPVQLTSFIGRDREIPEIKDLLGRSRLVTLLGTGGTGKTRLSIQVGADLIDDFPHGVFLVELAPVTDPFWIPETVLNSLKIKEEKGRSIQDTLISFLSDKEMLMIIDNCEHLINECTHFCQLLLVNCPKLKIIATSREALNCHGEQIYRVPALPVPDPAMMDTAEQLSQYSSVRLFIERSLSVNPDFRVNNENAPALAEICSRLDGIPLAIELAAARTKSMSVEKIHERLSDSFRLLTGGIRTALPRQQTLKNLIDWSYNLLSDSEKLLFARLSVFNGSWSLEAAEDICSDENIAGDEVFDLMCQLAEKSVINYDDNGERYKMLETIRQYGAEKLEASGTAEILNKKYYDHYFRFSSVNYDRIRGNSQIESMNIYDAEINNINKVLSGLMNLPDKLYGLRFIYNVFVYWEYKGDFTSMTKWNDTSLKYIDQLPDDFKSDFLYLSGFVNKSNGNYKEAERYLEESLIYRLRIANKAKIAQSLWLMGEIANIKGNFMKARANFERCIEIRKEIKNKTGITSVMNSLANIFIYQKNYEKARSLMLENLALLRDSNEKRPIAITLYNLALVENELAGNDPGEYGKLNEYLEESLLIFRELGNNMNIAYIYILYGLTEEKFGNPEKARILINDGLSLMRKANYRYGIGNALYNLAGIELNLRNYEQSKSLTRECLSIKLEFQDKRTIGSCFSRLSRIAESQSDNVKSVLLFASSQRINEDLGLILTDDEMQSNDEFYSRQRSTLGNDVFSELMEKGRTLTLEQAAEIALKD